MQDKPDIDHIMPTNFKPIYSITPGIAKIMMRIEAAKEKVALLPVFYSSRLFT